MNNISPVATQHHVDKADHFLHGMNLLADDPSHYRTAIGLLAIHSAISLSDAITVGLTGKRGKYQDHGRGATELEGLCSSNRVSDKKGIAHFKWLLPRKSAVAYRSDRLDDASVKMAVDRAQRFNAWAYNEFREVLRAKEGA
jgi:hypothetical protein